MVGQSSHTGVESWKLLKNKWKVVTKASKSVFIPSNVGCFFKLHFCVEWMHLYVTALFVNFFLIFYNNDDNEKKSNNKRYVCKGRCKAF